MARTAKRMTVGAPLRHRHCIIRQNTPLNSHAGHHPSRVSLPMLKTRDGNAITVLSKCLNRLTAALALCGKDLMNSKEESAKLLQEFAGCQKMLTALGDETRQQLLSIMIMGPCSGMRVIDIAEQTSLSRPAVSHHMQILKDAGVVLSRKDGTCIYYRLNPNREAVERLGRLLVHVNQIIEDHAQKEC